MPSPKAPERFGTDTIDDNADSLHSDWNSERSRTPRPYHRSSLNVSSESVQTYNSRPDTPSGGTIDRDYEEWSRYRALPAPVIRPRKGLIGSQEFDPVEEFAPIKPVNDVGNLLDGQHDQEHMKAAKRGGGVLPSSGWRIDLHELLRRICEGLNLMSIGLLTVHSHSFDVYALQLLSICLGSLCCLLLLYCLHIVCRPWIYHRNARLGSLLLPTSLEPATFIYPLFLPLFVAIAIGPPSRHPWTSNAILGLSTLPEILFPQIYHGPSINLVHWILTLTPLACCTSTQSEINAALLYPLHRTLLVPLRYLTTTSLLESELQLLSVGLINLIQFATSPPMKVLKAVLWLGGSGLLFVCVPSSRRLVALERIPKFGRTASTAWYLSDRFLVSLGRGFGIPLSIHHAPLHSPSAEHTLDQAQTNGLEILPASRAPGLMRNNTVHAVYRPRYNTAISSTSSTAQSRYRSKSLSVLAPDTASSRTAKSMTSLLSSLSDFELVVQSLIFNVWTYIVVLFLILVPIRLVIGKTALDDHEPFSWALGYLFGDIIWVRQLVQQKKLSSIILVPPAPRNFLESCMGTVSWVDCARHHAVGLANTRLALFAYWAVVVSAGVAIVLTLSKSAEVDTRRKVFHGTMVVILLPTAFIDPLFLALGLVLVLAVFLLLDFFRAAQVKPLSRPLAVFLQPYVDGRDLRGPVIVSHIFLLIGCAIPMWLSIAGQTLQDLGPWKDWDVSGRDVSMVAGVVCVGLGGAAASLIGRRFGRHKWKWSGGKSLEGSAAFAVAVTAGLVTAKAWLVAGGWERSSETKGSDWLMVLCKCFAAGCGASFTEAVLTGCNDNVVVPVVLWLLARGLGI